MGEERAQAVGDGRAWLCAEAGAATILAVAMMGLLVTVTVAVGGDHVDPRQALMLVNG